MQTCYLDKTFTFYFILHNKDNYAFSHWFWSRCLYAEVWVYKMISISLCSSKAYLNSEKFSNASVKIGIHNILILLIVSLSRWSMRPKGNKHHGLEIRIQGFLPPRSIFREALVEDLKVKGSLPESDHELMGLRTLMKERRITWKTK